MKEILKLGQELYYVVRSDRGNPDKCYNCKVHSIGRKYLTVISEEIPWLEEDKFYLDTWELKSEYTSYIKLYLSKEIYEEKKLIKKLSGEIEDIFNKNKYTKKDWTAKELQDILNIIKGGN